MQSEKKRGNKKNQIRELLIRMLQEKESERSLSDCGETTENLVVGENGRRAKGQNLQTKSGELNQKQWVAVAEVGAGRQLQEGEPFGPAGNGS